MKFIITEGVEGYWNYHWSRKESHWVALCGARTMTTCMPPDAWGQTGHLNEKYCDTCEQLKNAGA